MHVELILLSHMNDRGLASSRSTKMFVKLMSLILLVALATSAISAPISTYGVRCNSGQLSNRVWADCIEQLVAQEDRCQAISATDRYYFCKHAYAFSLDGQAHQAPCHEVTRALSYLWSVCHERGGSTRVGSNDQFIVHVE